MNTIPPQIPATDNRLLAMLGGAKKVMQKVETGDYSPGNIDATMMVASDQLVEGSAVPQQYQQQSYAQQQQQLSREQVYANSKLPDAIKEAMRNTPPTPTWNPNHTFNLEDVAELVEKPIPMAQPRQPQQRVQPNQQQMLEQQYQQQFQQQPQVPAGMMMVNEAQLKQMMKDFMLEFMSNVFTKNLSEEVIKKTIGTLIKEGKITAKTTPAVKK